MPSCKKLAPSYAERYSPDADHGTFSVKGRNRIVSPTGCTLRRMRSLDSGGDYAPVVLSQRGNGANCLERVWPVAGILFELRS